MGIGQHQEHFIKLLITCADEIYASPWIVEDFRNSRNASMISQIQGVHVSSFAHDSTLSVVLFSELLTLKETST